MEASKTTTAALESGVVSQGAARRVLSIAVVLTGVFVSALSIFIVNIAFPALRTSFPSSSLGDISWVLSASAITFAAVLMPAGRLADRFGRKLAFLSGMALFTAASAACAAAPSVGVLIAARIVQAVGGAMMVPSSLGLLLTLFPPARRGAAIGLWSAMSGAAAAAGPPIGGLLVQYDWRWVFLANLPVGILAVLIGLWTLQEIREKSGKVPDVFGALLLAATVAATVAAIVQGQDWGWDSQRIRLLFAAGAVGLVLSVERLFWHPVPVIEPAILRIRSVSFADLATMVFFAGFGAMVLGTTLFLTGAWHHTILRAGLEIAPGPVMAALVSVPAGVLAARSRHGVRVLGLLGGIFFGVMAISWVAATTYSPDHVSDWLSRIWPGTTVSPTDYGIRIFPGAIVGGAGVGLILPCLSGAATLPLPPQRFATGAAFMSMCRQVGLALGVAAVAAILDVRPDLNAFHRTFLFIAACSVASGIVMLAVGIERRPAATHLVIEKG